MLHGTMLHKHKNKGNVLALSLLQTRISWVRGATTWWPANAAAALALNLLQIREARIEANKRTLAGATPLHVPLMSLKPEDGFRMDAVKSSFRLCFGYDLDNRRLGECRPAATGFGLRFPHPPALPLFS